MTDYKKVWGLKNTSPGLYGRQHQTNRFIVYWGVRRINSIHEIQNHMSSVLYYFLPKGVEFPISAIVKLFSDNQVVFYAEMNDVLDEMQKIISGSIVVHFQIGGKNSSCALTILR